MRLIFQIIIKHAYCFVVVVVVVVVWFYETSQGLSDGNRYQCGLSSYGSAHSYEKLTAVTFVCLFCFVFVFVFVLCVSALWEGRCCWCWKVFL